MRLPRTVLAAFLVTAFLAGCIADEPHDHMMGPDSYGMELSGMPLLVSPGGMFNVTVRAVAHGDMHEHMSDHIGAHFWNQTQSDPTGTITGSTVCVHQPGELPGTYAAMCTAPMKAGMYHLRSHARMDGEGDEKHHWWSDEQTFTVA